MTEVDGFGDDLKKVPEETSFIQPATPGGLDPVPQQTVNIQNDPIANAISILLKKGFPDLETIVKTKLMGSASSEF